MQYIGTEQGSLRLLRKIFTASNKSNGHTETKEEKRSRPEGGSGKSPAVRTAHSVCRA
jgi:hypothetical protein